MGQACQHGYLQGRIYCSWEWGTCALNDADFQRRGDATTKREVPLILPWWFDRCRGNITPPSLSRSYGVMMTIGGVSNLFTRVRGSHASATRRTNCTLKTDLPADTISDSFVDCDERVIAGWWNHCVYGGIISHNALCVWVISHNALWNICFKWGDSLFVGSYCL